jgi:[protein-PII] uridylyltransferase
VAGLNIISAKITTRSDHIAIDTFEVSEPGHGPVRDAPARELFTHTVETALMGTKDLDADIATQIKKFSNPAGGTTSPSVEVYLEIASPRVIVEIHAPDRFGLLYRVGHVFAEQGYSLAAARVHTQRGLAIDSFFLESGEKISFDGERLARLKTALTMILSPGLPG